MTASGCAKDGLGESLPSTSRQSWLSHSESGRRLRRCCSPGLAHGVPAAWQPYQPSKAAPWNARRIVHLFRRAAFGATRQQLQRALQVGYAKTLDRLLSGTVYEPSPNAHRSRESFHRMQKLLVNAAMDSNHQAKLQAAWVFRMLRSPDPLAEHLTLMWHNHFATSNFKVQNVRMMWEQNKLFRRSCRGPFGQLLHQVLKDPALLTWLDADANSKHSPNENLARELLELFTLGIDHCTEQDVKETARALTGRTLRDGLCVDDPSEHDPHLKTILGRTERFTPHGLVDLLVAHPATSRRLAWRICRHLLGEDVATAEQIDSLAAGLRQRQLDVGWAVKTVLASEAFFSKATLGRRISPPVVFITSSV